jgi:hypothetical protein
MPDLFLRKVTGHPQIQNAWRVILKSEDGETGIGSIGTQFRAGPDLLWRWGIDTVLPMREIETEGDGTDRKDCMRKFKAAWERFAADPARFVEFMETKKRARRGG